MLNLLNEFFTKCESILNCVCFRRSVFKEKVYLCKFIFSFKHSLPFVLNRTSWRLSCFENNGKLSRKKFLLHTSKLSRLFALYYIMYKKENALLIKKYQFSTLTYE